MTRTIALTTFQKNLKKILEELKESADRFIITLDGKPVGGLVSCKDLEKLEKPQKPEGLAAVIGKWKDFEEVEDNIAKIVESRTKEKNRAIPF
jgi:prevent-host-death family protein